MDRNNGGGVQGGIGPGVLAGQHDPRGIYNQNRIHMAEEAGGEKRWDGPTQPAGQQSSLRERVWKRFHHQREQAASLPQTERLINLMDQHPEVVELVEGLLSFR